MLYLQIVRSIFFLSFWTQNEKHLHFPPPDGIDDTDDTPKVNSIFIVDNYLTIILQRENIIYGGNVTYTPSIIS